MPYLIIIIVVIVLYIAAAYNGLVQLKIRSQEAWSDIDVQLKRRYDLIPNLIETVKGYAKHEKEVFKQVTEARTAAMSAKSVKGQEQAENQLSAALKSVFAIAEAYPKLQASDNFGKLQDELSDTENKIEAARRFYNANVRDLNTKIESFPTNLIASTFNFEQRELFEVQEAIEREAPKVKFEKK